MEVELPDYFRCPISLEVMTDPVILPSGHTFDRPSIQRWLDSGNRTCPVTNLPLPPSPSLIPNHALRSLISTFAPRKSSSSSPPSPAAGARCDGDDDDLRALAAALSTSSSDAATLASAARLAKRSPAFRRLVAESGATSALLRRAADGDRPDLQDHAIRVLLHLSLDGDETRVGLVAEGAVDALAAAIGGRSAALAATTLTSLAVVDVNKCSIGAHPVAITGLAALLRDGVGARERREAATALYELCKLPENRRRAVMAGVVSPLIRFAGAGSERAVEVLGLLAKCPEGKEAMKAQALNFIRVLAEILLVGHARSVEHALLALNLVCSGCREMALEAIKGGILKLALNYTHHENEKVAKNAIGLARKLEQFHNKLL